MQDFKLSSREMIRTDLQVNELNKKIGVKVPGEKNSLGKDSCLRLLVTQLQHQDPTKPMEDREFISQMAQFSALEQMTNMNKEFQTLLKSSRSSEAYGLLGKNVEGYSPNTGVRVSGTVESVYYRDDDLRLNVAGKEISINDVHAVHLNNKINDVNKKQ